MEQFATLTQQKVPAFEMPDGYILYVGYNRETDTLDVGQMTNAGLAVQYSFPFNHNVTLEANLQEVNENRTIWKNTKPRCKRKITSAVCIGKQETPCRA